MSNENLTPEEKETLGGLLDVKLDVVEFRTKVIQLGQQMFKDPRMFYAHLRMITTQMEDVDPSLISMWNIAEKRADEDIKGGRYDKFKGRL